MTRIALRFTTALLLALGLAGAVRAADPARSGPPPQAFIWVGHPERGFTDDEIRYIADHYALIVINPIHGTWDPAARHHDAKRLKASNPDIKVFPYFSMSLRYRRDKFGTDTFRQEWLLQDERTREAAPLTATRRRPGEADRQVVLAWFVDLSQEAYRRWALQVLQEWLASAPYDGVAFDSAVPLDRDPARRREQLRRVELSPEKVSAWNDGLARMLSESRDLGVGKREVIYNGIAELRTAEDRNVGLLKYADMALNEDFCIAPQRGVKNQILPANVLARDIKLMAAIAAQGKKILQKTNYRSEAAVSGLPGGLDQAARFCYAVFLMGYVPDRHYFKFGMNYNAQQGELTKNAREIALPLGAPKGPYTAMGGVWVRRFDNGTVYVNPDEKSARAVSIDEASILMNGNENRGALARGSRVEIPAQDVLFLLDPAAPGRKRAPGTREPRPMSLEPAVVQ